MAANPELAHNILRPTKMQGVEQLPASTQEDGSFETGCPSWTPCPFESEV
jgi:hypothetical protein